MSRGRLLFAAIYLSICILLIYSIDGYIKTNKSDLVIEKEKIIAIREVEEVDSLPRNVLGSSQRLSTKNQLYILNYCTKIGVDPYFIMAVSLTVNDGYVNDMFLSNPGKPIEYQINEFLMDSGIVDKNIMSNTGDSKFILRKSYLKGFVDMYGKSKLTRLYNNYYLIAGKHIE